MRRHSNTYRLQLIKETAENHTHRQHTHPMAVHIDNLLSRQQAKPKIEKEMTQNTRFAGYHYDKSIDGWVSDRWS